MPLSWRTYYVHHPESGATAELFHTTAPGTPRPHRVVRLWVPPGGAYPPGPMSPDAFKAWFRAQPAGVMFLFADEA